MKIVFSNLVPSSVSAGTYNAADNISAGFPAPSQDYRLVVRGGALDWQAVALVVPWDEGRGICDGCVDSFFSYNFLQAGFRLSG